MKIIKLIIAILIFTSSCSMIKEDLEPCATEPNLKLTVDFIYDYNIQMQDLFSEHVGSVYLYIFDNEGVFRIKREAHRAEMGLKTDFSMTFDTTEVKPGRTYQFVAVAQSNILGYEDSREKKGFALMNEMIEGVSTINDYILKLDRDDDSYYDFGIVNYKDDFGHEEAMIDTLWTTKPDEVQIINIPKIDFVPWEAQLPDQEVFVTVPMMRITNSITVNLVNKNFNANTSVDDYHFLIDFPNGNGTIDFTGNTLPAQELYYQSLRKSLVPYIEKGAGSSRANEYGSEIYAINAVFGVSRLQCTDGSSLQIRDAETNEIIAKIDNFSDFLADYFQHGFDDNQEFLDREYDFEIDILLDDEEESIEWIQIGVGVLGWSKRIYNYEL